MYSQFELKRSEDPDGSPSPQEAQDAVEEQHAKLTYRYIKIHHLSRHLLPELLLSVFVVFRVLYLAKVSSEVVISDGAVGGECVCWISPGSQSLEQHQ